MTWPLYTTTCETHLPELIDISKSMASIKVGYDLATVHHSCETHLPELIDISKAKASTEKKYQYC
jgi:hypothetical protein